MASDLVSLIDELDGPVDLIGHSMGGKAAMLFACPARSLQRNLWNPNSARGQEPQGPKTR